MKNCLFTYRIRPAGQDDVVNDNYINPLNVISFYWETRAEDKAKRLNIFLVNGKSMNISEVIGTKFVSHMEDFLRYMLFGPQAMERTEFHSNPPQQARPKRRQMENVEIVDEEIPQESVAEWAPNS